VHHLGGTLESVDNDEDLRVGSRRGSRHQFYAATSNHGLPCRTARPTGSSVSSASILSSFPRDPEWQNRNDCSKHRRLQAMAHERIGKRSVRRQRARQYLENRFYRNIPG
jgi:hypothetical protein